MQAEANGISDAGEEAGTRQPRGMRESSAGGNIQKFDADGARTWGSEAQQPGTKEGDSS